MVGRNSGLRQLLLSFSLFIGITATHAVDYLKVEAKAGDGITVLLNRYDLANFSCNIDSFLAFNDLDANSFLILGKNYVLPIQVHAYNGRSIRTTIGISNYERALDIQHYNERMLDHGVRDKDFRIDRQLWVPIHTLVCPQEEELVEVASVETEVLNSEHENDAQNILRYENFPILGKDYERTPILSEDLKGHVYYLISGHGGPDPGAIGHKEGHMLCEDEYAYDVTLRLARNLLQHGATVYMITRDENDGIRDEEYLTHDKDETVWYNQPIPLNQVRRLRQRTQKINELYVKHRSEGVTYQRVVEIHIDSRYAKQKVDIFFYHYPGSSTGEKMANTMLQTIKSEYEEHQRHRGYHGVVKSRNLHTLRESMAPAVYIELGNITNDFDQRRLLIVNNRQAIANWLAQGMIEHVNH